MAIDFETVRTSMPTAVPMMGTLNIEFLELESQRCLLRLPDSSVYHNHIGGPHAGAMFTLAESASGALVLTNFGDRLAEATPLAVEATIRYLKVAMGDVTAEATMASDPADVLAELAAGSRPEFEVVVTIRDRDGVDTGIMTVLWTLRPNRRR